MYEKIKPDLLIQNAKIRVLDNKGTVNQSLAAANGWIIDIGSNEDLADLADPQRVDMTILGGRVVYSNL